MKAASLYGLFLLLLMPLMGGTDQKNPLIKNTLPIQISDFYDNCNYVCAYSTRNERMKILDALYKEERLPEDSSGRLACVRDRMIKIRDHVRMLDPEMVLKSKGPTPMDRNLFFRTERVTVQSYRKEGHKLSVKLTVFELEPEDVVKFISAYHQEEQNGRRPSSPDQLPKPSSRTIEKTEYHDWTLRDGKWMKTDGRYLLLKR